MIAKLYNQLKTPLVMNGYALVFSSGATSVLGFGYWILAARLYTEETVGLGSALIAMMFFLANVSQLNLVNALNRFVPTAGAQTAGLVLKSYGLSVVMAVVASVVFLAGLELWAPSLSGLRSSPAQSAWFVGATVSWCLFALQDSVLVGLRQAKWVPLENIVYALVKLSLIVIFATALPENGIFMSWTVPVLLLTLPVNALIFFRLIPAHVRAAPLPPAAVSARAIVRYVAGDYLSSLVWTATVALPPLLILERLGAPASARFYLAWNISYALYLISVNMGMSLVTEGSRDEKNLEHYGYETLLQTLRLLVPLVAGIVLGAPLILRLYGDAYAADGSALLRLLSLSAIPYAFVFIYVSIARVQRRIRSVFFVFAALCTLVLIFAYLFSSRYGVTGVGLAWLLAQSVVALVLLFTGLRRVWRPRLELPGPARTLPGFLRGGFARRHLLLAEEPLPATAKLRGALPWAALTLAAALWGVSLRGLDLEQLGDFGLVTLLPATFYAALTLLTASFSVIVWSPKPQKWLLLAHLVLFIAMFHATPALTYGSLRYSWAWKHLGIVDYILRHGVVDRTLSNLSAYHNWPGFFAASALLSKTAGFSSALSFAAWAPALFNLLNLGALLVLFRALVKNERLVWLALWFVVITSWVGQDYFSPQAFAYFLYLVILAATALWFADRRGVALAQSSEGAVASRWQARPTRGVVRVSLLLMVTLFAAVSSSHQLTPIVTVLSLGALTLFSRNRALGLPVLMAVFATTWIVYGATPFFRGEVRDLIESFGRVAGNVDETLIDFASLSRGQQSNAVAARVLTLTVWALAFSGVVKHLLERFTRRERPDWGLICLAGAPFLLLGGGAYGGEVIFRIYLFSLPFMALWGAYLLFSITQAHRFWVRTGVTFAVSAVLLSGFTLAYFGKEQEFYFSPTEVEAAQVMYDAAPEGALIVEGSPNYPAKYRNYEFYTQVAISREPLASRLRVLGKPVESMKRWMSSQAYTDAYLILTRSQEVSAEPLGALPPGAIKAMRRALLASPEFKVIYESDDAVVLTLRKRARRETL